MTARRVLTPLYLLVAGAAALSTGCEKKLTIDNPPTNQPPRVELTAAPFNDNTAYFYAYRLNWSGYDPDGRVEKYQYAIDPPSNFIMPVCCPETETSPDCPPPPCWVETTRNEQILFFTAKDSLVRNPDRAIDFHTFAIRAIDDAGDTSAVVTRSFFSFTQAPTVSILSPSPRSLVNVGLSPAVRISWTGTDPDGQFTTKPLKYKYLLIGPGSEFPLDLAVSNPDSVRRYYAPRFAGWDSTSADTTEVQFTNLTPGQNFLFVVVAFDEAGAYSPVFDLNSNMLRFRVGFAGNLGPTLTMFNEFFNFSYSSGGYSTDPSREVFIEVPANARVAFNWFASSVGGSEVASYRWALDIPDVSDNTPREDEERDVTRWSSASLLSTQAVVGPFAGGEEHRFYIEAVDNNGLRSLGIVRFQVVAASFARELLIVDDTRFLGDEIQAGTGCVRPPIGRWPTAAELDTFLFAKGNVPWRCYPAGTITAPGLFAGYAFDTLGTRTGDNETIVRLAKLGDYRHVIWLVDGRSATFNRPGSDPAQPITSLRYMSAPGRFNSLSAYVKQGGRVWLAGGGGGFASQIGFNSANNDGAGITFSNALGELVPGRFMYDIAAWRSEFKIVSAGGFVNRDLGRNPSWPGAPDYNRLPPQMRNRTAANSPVPPLRTAGSYYKTTVDIEYMSLQNFILEDLDPNPDLVNEQSVLDSVYRFDSFQLPPSTAKRVCMTYYHGLLSQEFVFTGFAIWDYVTSDCLTLVDFVLQDIWGLTRTLPPAPRAVAAPVTARAASPAVPTAGRTAPSGISRPPAPGASRAPSRE